MELDGLFDGSLDTKMDFLNEKPNVKNDGIYRVDLSKATDKKWRSVIRFLPNLSKDGKVGQSAIEKISHYVNIKNPSELAGWFDSPKNFGEKCPLTDLYYTMQNSKNAVLIEKSKQLNYSKKYYSYVLVLEDEQQPELVGKIMIYQYGKTIKDKIQQEKNGEISGVPCNVFSLQSGKDFVIIAKEIKTGDDTYPDYKSCTFKSNMTSLPIFFEKTKEFKHIPVTPEGTIAPEVQVKVKDFLLNREHEIEEFEPKPLTDEQQGKINEITNFLTGKASATFRESKPSSNDFDLDTSSDVTETVSTTSNDVDEDDFFADL